jgi:DNA-binding transcriptional ArsR family regulator
MTPASISHHLNVLREAKLVQSERQGRSIVYSADTTVFHDAVEQLLRLLDTGGKQ